MTAENARGIIIAAPASGCGKTTVTLGLLRHLRRAGRSVASAKVGPDYIDPAFHAAASGRSCPNIDSWAMRPEVAAAALADVGAEVEIVVCEGVMGLFDGAASGSNERDGSTADLARLTGWPVVLVVDARAQAASAAAVVRGFASHARDVTVGGVIFNRIGGQRHGDILRGAMAENLPEIPVLGCLPRHDDLQLPERHLGLVQAGEHPELEQFLERAADWIGGHLDVPALIGLAAPVHALPASRVAALPPLGQRIAVARDEAFAFCYPRILEGWRDAGADVMPFSPLAGEAPANDADAIYLPGGYPELHAGRLAGCESFLEGLRSAAGRGASLFGECGGYMVLGTALTDADGQRHAMAGLLPVETSFAERKLHLGYRRVTLSAASPLGVAGAAYRGHEFHYTAILGEGPGEPLFQAWDAEGHDLGTCGLRVGSTMGSFIHLIDAE